MAVEQLKIISYTIRPHGLSQKYTQCSAWIWQRIKWAEHKGLLLGSDPQTEE